jgi:glycosyltransferase involved in cell wall biosynthesis
MASVRSLAQPPVGSDHDLSGRRILILNWRDTQHPEGGGSEVYVEQIATGLVRRGALVTMLCPRFPGAHGRTAIHGITIRRRGGRLSIYLWAPLMYLLGLLGRQDLIIEIQNGVPFLSALYARCPVLVVVHHVHREQWPIVLGAKAARFGWWLESRVAPRVNRHVQYVTVSDATRRELALLGVSPERTAIIHNGSPARDDFTDPRPAPTRSAQPTVLVLGRLVPHKRVELAVGAIARLRHEIPGLRLVIAGSGWWHDEILRCARDRNVEDRVMMLGHVDESVKHDLLAAAWVLAVPSVKEGWGLVVAEAAGHQTPAIGFRSAGGLNESIVDARTGVLVDDETEFTAQLGRLLVNPDLRRRLGRAAQQHAGRFTWETAQEDFAGMVEELLRRGQTAS